MRGCVALAAYIGVIALISPQLIAQSMQAEVRYLTPIIPLGLALQVGALTAVLGTRKAWLGLVAAIAFGTNLLNGGPFLPWGLRCTLLDYTGELSLPQAEPYTPTSEWINANAPANATIWVDPFYASYPLMFAAPQATYGWQLSWPPGRGFESLPPIDFSGRVAPDYIIAFGNVNASVSGIEKQNLIPGFHYELATTIPVFWKDTYRPELYWRRFESMTRFDPDREGVFIYRRTK